MSRPTLYEYAGGAPALLRLSTAHHRLCLADAQLNHPFSHADLDPRHIERLAAYWGEVLGGPADFSARLGDHSGVVRMHAGQGDMGDLGRRFTDCFVQAADEAALPQDPQFRAALRAYMEWAVQEMVGHPDSDEDVPAGMPVPRWTWDGLVTARSAPRSRL